MRGLLVPVQLSILGLQEKFFGIELLDHWHSLYEGSTAIQASLCVWDRTYESGDKIISGNTTTQDSSEFLAANSYISGLPKFGELPSALVL